MFHSVSDKWAAQHPTARKMAEMKAAQTALFFLWQDGIYVEGSQVWEVKTQPPESLVIWGGLEVVLGGGGAIKANRRGPHQERHGGRTEEKSFPFNNAGADEVWSLKRKAKKVWACRETRSVLYWVSYFSLVTMITTYSLISRMIAVIKLNASSVRVLLNV